jgi:hypothetical protein
VIRLLLLLLVLPSAALAQGSFGGHEAAEPDPDLSGARKAIVVGINDYDDAGFAQLQFARKDAEDLAAVLASPEFGGFSSVEIVVDGDLTAHGLMKRLEAWKATLAPEDFAFVYFSGHGTRQIDEKKRSRVFLAGSDTNRADPLGSGIPLEAAQEFLQTLPASRRALVVDACFTGDGKVEAGDAERAAKAYVDEELPFSERFSEKEAQLYATTYGRPALESNELQHGVYTANFIAALSERFDEADLNGDLVVSVSEAHDLARDRTMSTTSAMQVPMAFYKVIGRELLILSGDPASRKRVESALVAAYDGPQQGLAFFVDGQEKGAFPRTVLVDPGLHTVEFRNTKGAVVDRGRFRFKKEGKYSVQNIRDSLNGGRHLLAIGYAHTWMPGEAYQTEGLPSAFGARFAYSFRPPSRVPLLRKLGFVVDAVVGVYPEWADTSANLPTAPATMHIEVGVGPILRIDLPFILLSVQPRFAAILLARSESRQPYLNWLVGTVGGTFAFGVRPTNRFSVQVQYTPQLFHAPLKGGSPVVDISHRATGTVEFGF